MPTGHDRGERTYLRTMCASGRRAGGGDLGRAGVVSDDGTVTLEELAAMGIDPDDTEIPAWSWRDLSPDDLRSVATSLLSIAEQLITDGENVPADLRVDLINLSNVDVAPFDLRARASRLATRFFN